MRRARFVSLGAALAIAGALGGTAHAEKSGVRPNVISLPGGPGTMGGLGEQFEPTLNTGSATYKVALDVPPGTAGFSPSLALRYDSGQGNGAVGIGWSLDVGSVQRMTSHGVPRYDAADRFAWDGQELVAMGGGVFRLKIEGAFVRFRQSGDHWEADAPDGTTLRFGVSAGARSGTAAGTFRWALEEMIDVSGNRIRFSYEAERGQLYLTRIDYNVRPGAARNAVDVGYEARADVITDFRAGFGIATARRIATIKMTAGGAQVRRYRLRYAPDATTSAISKLASVTMFGTDDRTSLPEISFGYTGFEPAAQQVATIANPPAFSLADPNTELTDFDGDGTPDLVRAALGRHEVALNQGGRFAGVVPIPSNPSVQLAASGTELADIDGDGIVDLLSKLSPGAGDFVIFPNRGRGDWEPSTRFRSNPAFSFEDPGVRLIDIDGDGLVDVMQTTPTQYHYWRNNGDGSWGAPFGSAPISDQPVAFSDAQVRLADMNGDRLIDLVHVRAGAIVYWPNLGWGRWGASVAVLGAPDAGADQARVQLGDMNGDGLTDAWLAAGTELRIWLQRGDGRFAAPVAFSGLPDANPISTVVRVADMNGSGTADVVWNDTRAPADRVWRYLDLTGGVRPNLLETIENGMGRTIAIAYSSSGEMFRMAAAAGKPWKTRLPVPTQVVASATTSDGRGWSKQEAFVYADGHFDGPTKQFRGFGETKRIEPGNDEEATSIQVHRFDVGVTAEALKGAEVGLEIQTATGTVLRRESTGYEVHAYGTGIDGQTVTGADRRFRVTEHVEGTSPPVMTREEWTYDDHGGVLVHSSWGVIEGANVLVGRDERITTTDYAHDTSRWLLARPTRVLVTDASGARVTETRTYYDGDPFVGLPSGSLGTRGLPTRTESWVEGDRFVNMTRIQHDNFGLQVATLDPRGIRREVDYDPDTHLFPVAERLLLGDGKVLAFTAGYDAVAGLPSWYEDPSAGRTTFTYTALLQPASITKPGDSDAKPTLAFEYRYGNPTSEVISRSRTKVGGDELLEKHHHYDGLGRDIGIVEQAEGGKTVISGLKLFGPNGRVVREFEPAFTTGYEIAAPAAGTPFTAHRYDALGRRDRTVLPDGSATETRYRPLVVEHWDGEDLDPRSPHSGTPRIERSSGVGVVQVDERLGPDTVTTRFERDALGRIQQVIDAAGSTTSYDRDGLGRVRRLEHPDAGKSTIVFDDAGNPTMRTDARRATVATTYDGANRPLTETLTDAAGRVEERIVYHYDDPSPKFPGDRAALGELTWVEDAAGEEHYRHDERGHAVETVRVVDGREYRLATEYDNLDRLARVTYPDGRALDYRYTARGLLTEVPGILNRVDYDARGLAVRRAYANGAVSTAHYDVMDRVDALGTVARGQTLQALAVGYDRVGNVASITDSAHADGPFAATRTFGYDDLYRLRTAGGVAGRWTYDFDARGNWTAKSDVGAYSYAAKPHQPATAGGGAAGYEFDEAGQLTARPGSRQTYDAKGRLTTVKLDDGTVVAYRYDYAGMVAVKETTGPRGHHRIVYADKLAEERDGELVSYVFAAGLRIARLGGEHLDPVAAGMMRLPPVTGATAIFTLLLGAIVWLFRPAQRRRVPAFASLGLALLTFHAGCGDGPPAAAPGLSGAVYYHHDHLGGVVLETDESGAVVREASFDPYGGDLQPAAADAPHAFTGKERDPHTGLYDFGARVYDPKLGLFLQPDPAPLGDPELAVEDPQLLSIYGYARNNPTSHIDPDGRLPQILGGALVGGAIGAGSYLFKAARSGDFSWKSLGASTARGAVTGAIVAATGGAGLFVQGAVSNAAGGIVERAIETGSVTQSFSPKAILTDAAIGGAGSVVAGKVGAVVAPKVAGAAKALISRCRPTRPPGSGVGLGRSVGATKGPLNPEALKLESQFASESQVAEVIAGRGTSFAGAGSGKKIDDIRRIVKQHGGKKSDWAKVRSRNFEASDGVKFETHAYENYRTGAVVEVKTKFQ